VYAIEFYESNASGVVAAQDRSSISLNLRRDDRWFTIVSRRETGGLNWRLLRIFPIIVSKKQGFVSVM
jgi:hypothetical protein